MSIRSRLCFEISRRLIKPASKRTVDYAAYDEWRWETLSRLWGQFSDGHINGKTVVDFGCGDGQLSLFLAKHKAPARIIGVDLVAASIKRASNGARKLNLPNDQIEFLVGSTERMPLDEASADTIVAFDCLEHVMNPADILADWHRVLKPGGTCLMNWFPYKGPWGPHMESLVPIPWAHVVFGQAAMFRAAEAIYDLPEFEPRHWDLDESGNKKPNKWKQWSSFREQDYINELDISTLERLASDAGLVVSRLEKHSFSGSWLRRTTGKCLMALPLVGEYFVSYTVVELTKPAE
ncbi:MAG: class I SAM-dependent methyltransferase [Burkholderiaceae bacterium]